MSDTEDDRDDWTGDYCRDCGGDSLVCADCKERQTSAAILELQATVARLTQENAALRDQMAKLLAQIPGDE